MNSSLTPAAAAVLGTLVFSLLLNSLELIPFTGPIIHLTFAIVVIGAVLLTPFDLYTYTPPYQETGVK